MSVTQSGNTAGQDIVAGDKYQGVFLAPPTSLSRLYQILREADKATPYTSQIADQLQHYCATTTSADVRGLESR